MVSVFESSTFVRQVQTGTALSTNGTVVVTGQGERESPMHVNMIGMS